MTIPRFSAEASLYGTSERYQMAFADQSRAGIEPARMTPQWCYRRDSQCTRFCANVPDPNWRYECFSRCDIYLGNCLDRGKWTDRAVSL